MLIARVSIHEIDKLKKELLEEFAMKDLGATKQILGMRITRDREILKLSQEEYVKKKLNRFNMAREKPVSTPLAGHFRLSKDQSALTEQNQVYMAKVSYTFAIGSLMYVMICTRPNIGHVVGVVRKYMSNLGKQHWEAMKWIHRYLSGTIESTLCFTKLDLGL